MNNQTVSKVVNNLGDPNGHVYSALWNTVLDDAAHWALKDRLYHLIKIRELIDDEWWIA